MGKRDSVKRFSTSGFFSLNNPIWVPDSCSKIFLNVVASLPRHKQIGVVPLYAGIAQNHDPALCGIAMDHDPGLCGIALEHDPGLYGIARIHDPTLCGIERDQNGLARGQLIKLLEPCCMT
jgi:hypothetical protein